MKKFVVLLFVAIAASCSFAQPLPSGFVDTLVTTVSAPTELAVTPDGRMLVTTQPGNLMIFKGGALPLTTALAFNTGATGNEPKICAAGEQGLLGVAVDPAFTSNHYVYLFYTARNGSACTAGDYTVGGSYNAANTKVNRVSRFIFGSGVNADIIDPASELILIDRMPSRGTNHNAGDVHFGKDGHLYVSIGDGGTDYSGVSPGSGGANDASRDTHVLTGKLLRITRDGGIPADNPFTGAASGRCNVNGATTAGNHCQETFAWGLRNPFRFAMNPNASGTHAYINDVGQNLREEVDELQHGADYGWNCREATLVNSTAGPCNPTPPGMVDPIFSYGRSVGQGVNIACCASITGGAFVPNGVWPAAYNNTYLLADFICGGVFLIPTTGSPAAPIAAAATFTGALGGSSATSLRFAPDGNTKALYYTTYAAGGQVRKIAYSATVDISFTSIHSRLRLKVNDW